MLHLDFRKVILISLRVIGVLFNIDRARTTGQNIH
ncbi:hypothetical protein NEOC65_002208 [Neochlamydia sp. AcF65]|nr:hypothetical protein [Neochlamydia sp. AcF65]MBS4170249.1 hypothetical protein [Neochlamydia sp. AcF95]